MKISCMILAGGRATRMGGVDKGLVNLAGKPLIQHVIERVTPQIDEIFINANRALVQYGTFNLPIVEDEKPDFIGPLAGFKRALTHAKHDVVLIVPCDSPLLPNNVAAQLLAHLIEKQADIAVACSNGNAHPVVCLCKKTALPSLVNFINSGQRKVSFWQKSLRYIEVNFSHPNVDGITDAFLNLNTFDDLNALELLLQNESSA